MDRPHRLGFMVWWPLGLALLAFTVWSGRMACSRYGMERWQGKMARMQEKMDRMRTSMQGGGNGGGFWSPPSSGNRAFDEYRAETLRRLEDEQREFQDFLVRLREAKDKPSSTSSWPIVAAGRTSRRLRRNRLRRNSLAYRYVVECRR